MAGYTKPELSKKNKYWVEKHRYYELKHFCLQYPIWKKLYLESDSLVKSSSEPIYSRLKEPTDPTANCAATRLFYLEKMEAVEQAAIGADPDLSSYILKAVTEELSYDYLKSRLEIPCSRDTYYDRYRRFFWLLNKTKHYI